MQIKGTDEVMKTIDKRITDDETINEFLKKLFDLGIPFLIGIGGVTVVVSFFGFFGAIKESKCMLGIYIGLIVALFLVLVIAIILFFTKIEGLTEPMWELIEYITLPVLGSMMGFMVSCLCISNIHLEANHS